MKSPNGKNNLILFVYKSIENLIYVVKKWLDLYYNPFFDREEEA